ncbi:hypothetical protein BDP81DRAFT_424748 [Colletotrichum phormii]|uniref:Secreted protein n=1 Tax=Colletotrichum phormii TaxID=359342 RepID=A0AAI9ZUA1_9PEZI|nr:uncharacterized protein BDP81DRAFT_424748 [Colletotrichum phormii]KAK1638330.1 hypothetical protein BDP81DRAFT_424748 [Colletotrichum phormii]
MPTRRGRSNLILAHLSVFLPCLSHLLASAGPPLARVPRSQCPTAAPIMLLLVEGPFIAFIPEIWSGPPHLATAMPSQSGKISS